MSWDKCDTDPGIKILEKASLDSSVEATGSASSELIFQLTFFQEIFVCNFVGVNSPGILAGALGGILGMGLTLGILAAHGRATAVTWDVPGCCRMDTAQENPGNVGAQEQKDN